MDAFFGQRERANIDHLYGRLVQTVSRVTGQQLEQSSLTSPFVDAEAKSFEEFTVRVEDVEKDIRSADIALTRLDELVTVDSVLQEKEAAKECLETLASQATTVEGKLSSLMQSLADERARRSDAEPSTHERMKEAMTRKLRRKIMDLRARFPAIEQRLYTDRSDSLKRQETLEKEENSGLFTAMSFSSKTAEAARDLKVRHDAVISIQKELLAIHGLFLQVAMHVEEGGDMLNDIEAQANAVAEKMEHTTVDLTIAVETQKKRRRLCCCFGVSTALLVAIAVCAALFFFRADILPWLFPGLAMGGPGGAELGLSDDVHGTS
eukprot:TRINITY_DN16935_c0_g1_i1.p1 TRINITY_DN16935_c0_g1~~TRINITY_DN16935_c0_g1_i1.p1  ORF type:complete len:322 (+),score=65.07 TRINITY_DN16935_c0_g1_i1:348-1313(+)